MLSVSPERNREWESVFDFGHLYSHANEVIDGDHFYCRLRFDRAKADERTCPIDVFARLLQSSDVSFEREARASIDTHVLQRSSPFFNCREWNSVSEQYLWCLTDEGQSSIESYSSTSRNDLRHSVEQASTLFRLIKYSLKTEPFDESHSNYRTWLLNTISMWTTWSL